MGRKTRLTGSAALLAVTFVGGWEGLRLTAYLDEIASPARPTVCYGETLDVKMGDQHTKAECDAMLLASLRKHEAGMRACLTSPDAIPDRSYVAFVSLTYNIGVGAFCNSTAAKRLNAGDLKGACEAGTWYTKAGGRTITGLVNRRSAEHELCLEGANAPIGLETVEAQPKSKPAPVEPPLAKSRPEPADDFAVLPLVLFGLAFTAAIAGVIVMRRRKADR